MNLRRVALLTVPLLLLWAIQTEVNHLLSSRQLFFFAGGLHVAFIALTQPFGPGLAAVLVGGLLCDAATPFAFGTHAALFGFVGVPAEARARLPEDAMRAHCRRQLARMFVLTSGRIPLVGAGGVHDGASALLKIRAGASLARALDAAERPAEIDITTTLQHLFSQGAVVSVDLRADDHA